MCVACAGASLGAAAVLLRDHNGLHELVTWGCWTTSLGNRASFVDGTMDECEGAMLIL